MACTISIFGFQYCQAQVFSESFKPFTGTPEHYVCYHITDSITIDGKLDEAAWQQVNWTNDFVDIEGSKRPQPPLQTRVKMMWDQQYLYIAATLREPHIWATLRDHDAVIFHDNDFEVFIDPDGDTHQYYEIEINAFNTVMDLFMNKPYRNGGTAMLNWDTKGLKTAVHVNGSINQPGDTDKEWTVEMAIPFQAFRYFNSPERPQDSSIWRINFSRVEWDTDIRNNQYVKQRKPEHNWVWSAQDIINMHAPERWGYLLFTTQPAGNNHVQFRMPPAEQARQVLWQLYHQQQQYRQQHGRYAASLQQLQLPAKQTAANGVVYTLEVEGISSQYNARIQGSNFKGYININQEGRIYESRN
ncbi:carbohydrate-binding family 9-like protein [Chitinophaga sp. Mgbs1]|uniref:Carbohydrate-binding family 9-like protein n=1 Tax=Chitinophaga solisilvae TaxID=1233460 RepID=A0A9Q5DBR0_9BACT|nr:carbohydrate-binding family 9-like protein [Chitinophaga solisilvae]